jgi:ectoine hydroxylase-related dioxygenase (phytanoyl-CoA dioxygenase family)
MRKDAKSVDFKADPRLILSNMTVPLPNFDQHAQRLERDGYTILEGVIEPEVVNLIAEDLRRIEKERSIVPAQNLFEGLRTVRIYNLLAFGAPYDRIAEHEHILPLVERVIERQFLISSISSIAIQSEENPQPWHADDQHIPLPRPHVPIICNTMWAITDFTKDNGATRFVPGSHKATEFPPPFGDIDGAISAEMPRGSVLVYNGSLWHGGGANKTSERRVGVAMNYCAGWIRQQENQMLGIPMDVARGFSQRLQRMCGWSLYKKLMGHIDKAGPEYLLHGTAPKRW